MSKSNPSEVKLAVPTSGGFSGLKSLNLQVFVMIAAIIAIMLFFTWTTDGAYLSARNVSNLLRQTAITGILAVGMVFVIISAEIDLSVGSMMGLLGGVAAICDVWIRLAFATDHHCDVGSGTASRCLERMVGRVP